MSAAANTKLAAFTPANRKNTQRTPMLARAAATKPPSPKPALRVIPSVENQAGRSAGSAISLISARAPVQNPAWPALTTKAMRVISQAVRTNK
jgi:hypothetical protein